MRRYERGVVLSSLVFGISSSAPHLAEVFTSRPEPATVTNQ
jgi:hypothetical protein